MLLRWPQILCWPQINPVLVVTILALQCFMPCSYSDPRLALQCSMPCSYSDPRLALQCSMPCSCDASGLLLWWPQINTSKWFMHCCHGHLKVFLQHFMPFNFPLSSSFPEGALHHQEQPVATTELLFLFLASAHFFLSFFFFSFL